MSRKFRVLICVLAVVATSIAALGQLTTATVSGTVADQTGAVIPGATVLLTQTETNLTRSTTTDANGIYQAPFMPIGPYRMTVSAKGFETRTQSGIVLTVNQQATLNFSLQIGAQTTIEVTEQVPLLNQQNAVLGATMDKQQIDSLPLPDRNVYTLMTQTPGVESASNENSIGLPMEHVIINGSSDNMTGQVTYYLDGGLNMTGVRDTGNVLPNTDAVDQFNVQTNNFSAQYGRTGAGVISVVTKSGTNKVHGTLYEFHDETNFNASPYTIKTTSTQAAAPRTPEHLNHFGATVGGPALKNKIFFFGSYGGLRQITPANFNSKNVPDVQQRLGNFSENAVANGCTTANATGIGGCFKVYDPVTNTLVANGRLDQDPNFHIDPVATAVLAKVPVGTPGSYYNSSEGLPNQTDEYLIKGDFQLFPNHRVTLEYFQSLGSQTELPNSGNTMPNWALSNYEYRQQNGNASDVWTVSSQSVNQLWVNFSRMIAGRVSTPGESLAAFGSGINVQGTPSLPQIAVANFMTLGQSISGPLAGDTEDGIRDVFSTTRGAHTINVGGEVYLEKDRLETLLNNYGVFTFSNTGTSVAGSTHAAMADFLMGTPTQMSQDSPDDANEKYWNYALFAQDDWRILHDLTLNLGVRYDVQTAPIDTQLRIAVFDPGVQSTVSPNAMLGQLFPGDPGVPDGGVDTNLNHFAPRFGFVYNPFGSQRTVIQGGAGLFFDTISGNEWMLSQNFQPFAVRETNAFTHVTTLGPDIYSSDPTDFAPGAFPSVHYAYDLANPSYVSPAELVFVQKGMRWPYNYQMNFGVQEQVTSNLAVSASYVGALTRKLPLFIDRNAPVYSTTNAASNNTKDVNCRRPYDAIGFSSSADTACASPTAGSKFMSNGYVIEDGQTANYNALQVTVDKRMSKGFSINGYYIWSKGLASANMQTTGNIGNSTATEPEDYSDMRLERQRESNDMRHAVSVTAVWKPDYFGNFNSVTRTVLNGWTVATHISMHSGMPFAITSGVDDNDDGDNNDRPNLLPGMKERLLGAHRSRTAEEAEWFDTSVYCEVKSTGCPAGAGSAGQDGTVRYNSLSMPGYKSVDATIQRTFSIYRQVKFQFEGEATNVFNFVNLGGPSSAENSSTFGQITGADGMRYIQVGGHILF